MTSTSARSRASTYHDHGDCVIGRERPVVPGEPRLRQAEREEERGARETPRQPRTSGTNGTIQIRYCGESTLSKATSAATVAAAASSTASPSGLRRRAKTIQIATTVATLEHRREIRGETGSAPAQRLCAVRRDGRERAHAEVLGRHQHGGTEALHLERPVELVGEHRTQPVRRE